MLKKSIKTLSVIGLMLMLTGCDATDNPLVERLFTIVDNDTISEIGELTSEQLDAIPEYIEQAIENLNRSIEMVKGLGE